MRGNARFLYKIIELNLNFHYNLVEIIDYLSFIKLFYIKLRWESEKN